MLENELSLAIEDARAGKIDEKELLLVIDKYLVDVEDMENIDIMDMDEENDLVDRVISGDDKAKEELAFHHLALVTSIAIEYMDDGNILDIIDAGIRGLHVAVDRYDRRVGYRFSVHAIWWIRQTIVRDIR